MQKFVFCWIFAGTCVCAAVRFEARGDRFLSKDAGYDLLLTARGAELRFDSNQGVGLQFLGANPRPVMRGLDLQPGLTNYLIGSDRSRWLRGIRSYGRVEYADVYPGVNVVFYGGPEGSVEYDIAVSPGADIGKARLKLTGAQSLRLDHGDLVIKTGRREVRQRRPAVYQGDRRIECEYAVHGREIGFKLGVHDPEKSLVIDPILIYSTLFNGAVAQQPPVALDRDGNIYVFARTQTAPTHALIAKFDQRGQPVYSTQVGGSGGDEPSGIAVDSGGNAVVVGQTLSNDFPVRNPLAGTGPNKDFNFSGFILKLNQNGTDMLYSTYFGGEYTDVTGIALDPANNIFVTGSTQSQHFPTVRAIRTSIGTAAQNVFVSKISADGSQLLFSTYLGGSDYDQPGGIAVDLSGNAYVAGTTDSSDFPTVNALQARKKGAQNAFVAKLDTNAGALVYSTYLGGSLADGASGIAIDPAGDVYLCGSTFSKDFPVMNAFQATRSGNVNNAFVTKLDASGLVILYSTYLGGSGAAVGDEALAIAVDRFGNAFITGDTQSLDFPLIAPIQTGNRSGGYDAFVAVLGPTGNFLVYSTYLGGRDSSSGTGIAVDTNSTAYVVGYTQSLDFPVHHAAESVLHGEYGIFLTAISIQPIRSSPFGVLDTPADGATVSGSVPFTGWALDATGILNVDLWRDGSIYLTDARQYPGARPDVQSAYPNFPDNDRAGWGTMLFTNSLPDGTYHISAYAHNVGGRTQLLGTRTITIANAANPAPFGTIDTPAEDDTISGNSFVNFGWALTPQPASISAITVFIDGVGVGHPTYGESRFDVAGLFPAAKNSPNAGGSFTFDTTKLANGPHTISWSVTDSAGRTQGIGSRLFYVQN